MCVSDSVEELEVCGADGRCAGANVEELGDWRCAGANVEELEVCGAGWRCAGENVEEFEVCGGDGRCAGAIVAVV